MFRLSFGVIIMMSVEDEVPAYILILEIFSLLNHCSTVRH